MNPAQPHEIGQAPGNDQIDRESQLQFLDLPQLKFLDPATVLEDMKQGFDFPTATIPVNQLRCLIQGADATVGQQTPFEGLLSFRGAGVELALHRTAFSASSSR